MIKLKDCKVVADAHISCDQFELYINIITYTNNKQLNKLYNKVKDYKTIQFQNKKRENDFCIIHKSTKMENVIQVSYFDNRGAYADKERNTLKDALKEVYRSYKVKEAI